jgi:hypothetical protein
MCIWEIVIKICINYRITQWNNCLRHCATSRKVAGSIPDGVIEILK